MSSIKIPYHLNTCSTHSLTHLLTHSLTHHMYPHTLTLSFRKRTEHHEEGGIAFEREDGIT